MKILCTGMILFCFLLAQLVLAPLALAQQAPPQMRIGEKPVMENVFFNVVWGSIFGILLGAAVAAAEADEPSAPDDLGDTVLQGATAGGIIGLAAGLFLVASGITFDPDTATLFTRNDVDEFEQPIVARAAAPRTGPALPFVLETSTSGPMRITGFRTTVLDMRF